MKSFALAHTAVCNGAAAAILSGCDGWQPPIGVPAETVISGARVTDRGYSRAASARDDLIYIAHGEAARAGYRGVVTVLTFPAGKRFATIRLDGFGAGACSDVSGNVWVVVGQQNHKYDAYEFAHGRSKPIAKIAVAHSHGIAGDCAIDPATGDLAVVVGAINCGSCKAGVDIWKGAHNGKPETVSIPFTPVGCTYDDTGNLFVDGLVGSTVFFDFAELPKGNDRFHYVTLDKMPGGYPGGIRWDGSYVDIVADSFRNGPAVYRVDVSQYKGHVAGVVHLKDHFYAALFDVYGSSIVGTRGNNGRIISLWPYPAGGEPTKTLDRIERPPRGLAISAASARP
jgi:hypothetical protein